ncbi:hypothetical protein [Streptomyces sp. NPDC086766]
MASLVLSVLPGLPAAAAGGQQETITGPDRTKWSYTYDLFSRHLSR